MREQLNLIMSSGQRLDVVVIINFVPTQVL